MSGASRNVEPERFQVNGIVDVSSRLSNHRRSAFQLICWLVGVRVLLSAADTNLFSLHAGPESDKTAIRQRYGARDRRFRALTFRQNLNTCAILIKLIATGTNCVPCGLGNFHAICKGSFLII